MGLIARAAKGIGWPNPGWAPPSGYAGKSITDIIVNADTAMTVSAFHAGVRLIAEDIASLPLPVIERLTSGGRRKAEDHPTYRVLHDVANPDMTAMVWRETMFGHLIARGNCYSEKVFNGQGQVVELWPLRPDRMDPFRDERTGRRRYRYQLPSGEWIEIPAARVFHVPGFGFDGLVGYSRITAARRSLENAIAIEEYGLHTFANGAAPGVTIKHPGQLTAVAKKNIRESWEKQHEGLSNTQRTAILDEGMTLEQVGFTPEDAQFLDSRRHSVEEIARWLRLSPHKLSDLSRATFSNIEESNIDHVVGTLSPNMIRFEAQANKDLLSPPFFAKHTVTALLRGNAKDRAEYFATMRGNGLMTDEEIRDLEDLNPLTEEQRSRILIPVNTVPATAFGSDGMTMGQRANAAGVLRARGWDPAAVLETVGLPPMPYAAPAPPVPAAAARESHPVEMKAPDVHVHIDPGAIATTVVLPESIDMPAQPVPVINVAPPIVPPPDLAPVLRAIRELREHIDAPMQKDIHRDARGQITSITERRMEIA